MKKILLAFFSGLAIASGQTFDTNSISVQTHAGSGFYGFLDGQGVQTMFYNPSAIVADNAGNLFALDASNYRVRKIAPDGAVTTFAGGGTGTPPGFGTNVSLSGYGGISSTINSIAIGHSNVLWVTAGAGLFRIGTDGYVTASNPGIAHPGGLCVDSANNVYVSDYQDEKIYRWRTNGALEVFAGSGNQGALDGNGIFTSFHYPTALTADPSDNIYVCDAGNVVIRRINQNRDVVTVAGKVVDYSAPVSDGVGTNASFTSLSTSAKICTDNLGNLFIACGSSVRKMYTDSNVVTIAGSFTQSGFANGAGNVARFNGASGVCFSQGTLFVVDQNNERIRSIAFNATPQLVPSSALTSSLFAGITIDGTLGCTYQIQSSADLTSWSVEATVLLTSVPYPWVDPNPMGQKRFYRAVLLP